MARRLLRFFGSPGAIVSASSAEISALANPTLAGLLKTGPDSALLQRSLDWLAQPDHHLVCLGDPRYPPLLLEVADPPLVLYVKGRPELLGRNALAIVGTRSPTHRGTEDALRMAESLSNAGFTVVSGLALGIDTAAHEGALRGSSSSVAVMGTGLDRIYPARNRELAQRLARLGAWVSEFPLGSAARPDHFPRRNRIISGLARGCLVVEATLRSGSLITARMAADQGREVFALPGSIHSPQSKGCHWLIRQGATLVESATDVLEQLGTRTVSATLQIPASRHPSPTREVLEAVDFGPTDLDAICARSNLTPDSASAMLLMLELEGCIARLPGGFFQRLK